MLWWKRERPHDCDLFRLQSENGYWVSEKIGSVSVGTQHQMKYHICDCGRFEVRWMGDVITGRIPDGEDAAAYLKTKYHPRHGFGVPGSPEQQIRDERDRLADALEYVGGLLSEAVDELKSIQKGGD